MSTMRTLKPADLAPVIDSLVHPKRLFTRVEVLQKKCPVPSSSGIYAWFFKEIPEGVPSDECLTCARARLKQTMHDKIYPPNPIISISLPSGNVSRARKKW